MQEREKFSSRLGFILISAGCAIGLGNVWRFPYIAGENGGAVFVLIYLFFLIMLGLPIMVMEFAVGRASRKSVALSFRKLEPKGTKWHIFGYFAMAGNYLLMMFYTVICGWMFAYFTKMLCGEFVGADSKRVSAIFDALKSNPVEMTFWMSLAVLIGFGVCGLGLRRGVEKITKIMMSGLLGIMLILVIHSLTLENAAEGLLFYLKPDILKIKEIGVLNVITAAMGQAFFTLGIGIGSMAIFGSYTDKNRSLMGESLSILLLDTIVALFSGLIIFPACSAFGVEPSSGPELVFLTLPNIFNDMSGGRAWGSLFFIFMSFAALSTLIAVFQNIISFATDLLGWSGKKAVLVNLPLIILLSLPCVFGFNLWSELEPLGKESNIMVLEEFIVSNNLLPIGALVYLFFCVSRYGWGWDNFIREVNEGSGLKFPTWSKLYVKYILPAIIIFLFIQGYINNFFDK